MKENNVVAIKLKQILHVLNTFFQDYIVYPKLMKQANLCDTIISEVGTPTHLLAKSFKKVFENSPNVLNIFSKKIRLNSLKIKKILCSFPNLNIPQTLLLTLFVLYLTQKISTILLHCF